MLTKPLILAILAACGVNSSAATTEPPSEQPDKQPPDDEGVLDQHFCCADIDPKKPSGDGCLPIGKEHMASCGKVLYCSGNWTNVDGKVTCY
jgi:hypothetical protein